jgi:hypothetical protein
MEENPSKRQPADPVEFPGKMDHTTACTFLVGRIPEMSDENVDKEELSTKDEVDDQPDKKKQKSKEKRLSRGLSNVIQVSQVQS